MASKTYRDLTKDDLIGYWNALHGPMHQSDGQASGNYYGQIDGLVQDCSISSELPKHKMCFP